MEYTIVTDEWIDGLISRVKALINEGWIPQGGVAVYSNPINFDKDREIIRSDGFFIQAMVRSL